MTSPQWGPAVPPPQPQKSNTGRIVGFSCLGIVAAIALIGSCSALVATNVDTSDQPKANKPSAVRPSAPDPVTGECEAAVLKLYEKSLKGIDAEHRPDACSGLTDAQWSKVVDEQGDKIINGEVDVETSKPEPEEPSGPLSSFGTGTYLVGEDVKAGTYKTKGPETGGFFENCYWSRNKDDSGEFESIIANDNLQGPGRVTLNKGEVFETNGCQNWELSK